MRSALLALVSLLLTAPPLLPGATAGHFCDHDSVEAPGLGAGTLTPSQRAAFHHVVAILPENVFLVQPGLRGDSLGTMDLAANVDLYVMNMACTQVLCASTNPAPLPDVCVMPPGEYKSVIRYVSSTHGIADWYIVYVHGVPVPA